MGTSASASTRIASTAPATGLLSGTGCDQMCATVHVAAVPTQVPAELASLTRPVRDVDGRLTDWNLATGPTGPTESVIEQFEAFRRSFAVDFPLGERAFLSSLMSQADVFGSGALAQLRLREVILDVAAAVRLPGLLEAFERRCAARNATGWGVVRAGDTRVVRRLIGTDPPTTLLATPTAAVAVGHAGLRLLMRHRTITAWQETLEGMLLTTPTATVRIGRASLSAMMLKTIADGAGTASLRALPLVALAAPILGSLGAAADLAVQTGSGVDVRALPAWSAQRLNTAPAPSVTEGRVPVSGSENA